MATTLNLEISRVPAGTYTVVLDEADGTRAFRGNVTFGGGKGSVDLPLLDDDVLLKGYMDDGLPIVKRAAYIEGLTGADGIGELYDTTELFDTVEIYS
ncbi:MAG: hypothetical protein GY787_12295 [Alteromonadales bacterium]|nr:hypothetical protein [Alteromonadales bacterium]